MMNPDGVTVAQRGWVTDKQPPYLTNMPFTDSPHSYYYGWKANINGVDLNHNWPYYWKEDPKVKVPSSANYAGPYVMSEPETQAMNTLLPIRPVPEAFGFTVGWDNSSRTVLVATK